MSGTAQHSHEALLRSYVMQYDFILRAAFAMGHGVTLPAAGWLGTVTVQEV